MSMSKRAINTQEIRERAIASLHAARTGQPLPSIVDSVKPARVDKNDPSVKKLLAFIK